MEPSIFFDIFKKVSLPFILAIFIFTTIMLFVNDAILEKISVLSYKTNYKEYFGILFILSLSILSANLIPFLHKKFNEKKLVRIRKKNQEDYINNLTLDELKYLKPYLYGKNTQYFDICDGVSGGLLQKGILYQASSFGSLTHGHAYNIQPWALERLKNKKSIFSIYEKELS